MIIFQMIFSLRDLIFKFVKKLSSFVYGGRQTVRT